VVPSIASPKVSVVSVSTSAPRRGRFWPFAFGFVVGALALFGLALLASLRSL